MFAFGNPNNEQRWDKQTCLVWQLPDYILQELCSRERVDSKCHRFRDWSWRMNATCGALELEQQQPQLTTSVVATTTTAEVGEEDELALLTEDEETAFSNLCAAALVGSYDDFKSAAALVTKEHLREVAERFVDTVEIARYVFGTLQLGCHWAQSRCYLRAISLQNRELIDYMESVLGEERAMRCLRWRQAQLCQLLRARQRRSSDDDDASSGSDNERERALNGEDATSSSSSSSVAEAEQYECDGCGQDLINRARFHCLDCADFDLCQDCVSQPAGRFHPVHHSTIRV